VTTQARPLVQVGASAAFAFVFTMGIVNLFGDTTYEGGASINGQFLSSLGASAAAISIIAGAGEFLGYSLRSIAGWTADKTGVYALNTALDETGATIGPLLIAFALYRHASYRTGYSLLLISASLAFVALIVARIVFPVPAKLEQGEPATKIEGFTPNFWLYMVAAACFGAGLMSFEFISVHFASHHTVNEQWIPIFLGISTGFGVLANLVLGRLYDRAGISTVVGAVLVSALFSPFVFLGSFGVALFGMLLWGVGYATQDTLFKAIVADRLPEGRRNFAFGIFYTGYGGGWLIGSIATGLLYHVSVAAVIAFSMAVQLGSIPLFLFARRRESTS